MKKNILSFIFLFLLECIPNYGSYFSRINVVNDPYRKSIMVTMDMDHIVKMVSRTRWAYSYGTQYVKEIKQDPYAKVTYLIIMLQGSENMVGLNGEFYLNIDDKIEKQSLVSTNNSGKESTLIMQQSLGNSSSTTTVGSSSGNKVVTSRLNVLSGKLLLSNDLEKSILNAKKLSYRLYSGVEPIDIEISDLELSKIKEFLNHSGKENQTK